jgi:hypothetical protein
MRDSLRQDSLRQDWDSLRHRIQRKSVWELKPKCSEKPRSTLHYSTVIRSSMPSLSAAPFSHLVAPQRSEKVNPSKYYYWKADVREIEFRVVGRLPQHGGESAVAVEDHAYVPRGSVFQSFKEQGPSSLQGFSNQRTFSYPSPTDGHSNRGGFTCEKCFHSGELLRIDLVRFSAYPDFFDPT